MSADNKDTRFGLLRRLLRAFGLSQESVDDIVNWIVDLLAGKREEGMAQAPEFPYRQRDHFLSPAELCFFGALRSAAGERAALAVKVGLNDLFCVKTDDQSRYRIYTNRIDRKHVDFLLCEPTTMHPLVGIELDDKSHQRADRQARDEFVDQVFAAAGLPLLHIPARRGYVIAEMAAQLAPYLPKTSAPEMPGPTAKAETPTPIKEVPAEAPCCPKCGAVMVLRVAKSGANAGGRFWGCSNYPTCRTILQYKR